MSLLAETWPSIPLPFVDYSGQPRNASISGASEEKANTRRSRFEKAYVELKVKFIFTESEYAFFRVFYQVNLGNGVAAFGIQLRYPQNSALTWWEVRFLGEPESVYEEGHWTVDISIDLIQTYTP